VTGVCAVNVGLFYFNLFQEIDVNKEIDGRPPLHYAADYGQGDVIQYLLSKGANVNV
jgi:ankyrin repeat protein